MAKRFESKAKKTQKITKHGLVETNAVTGEQKQMSVRGQEFSLKEAAPEQTAFSRNSKDGTTRQAQHSSDFQDDRSVAALENHDNEVVGSERIRDLQQDTPIQNSSKTTTRQNEPSARTSCNLKSESKHKEHSSKSINKRKGSEFLPFLTKNHT